MRGFCQSLFALVGLLGSVPPALGQADWFVDQNAPGPGTGSVIDPFPTIQAAIDQPATVAGDRVLVLPGVYVENLDFGGKTIRVVSTSGADVTRIDGGGAGSAVRVASGEGPGTQLSGFRIQGGAGDVTPSGTAGGGVFVQGAFLELDDCVIADNQTTFQGGGVFVDGGFLAVADTQLTANLAPSGAGLFAVSSLLTLESSQFVSNGTPTAHGGGVRAVDSTLTTDGVLFLGNAGSFGGGLSADDSTVTLLDTVFNQNFAQIRGGGAQVEGGTLVIQASDFLLNNVAGFSAGAGLYVDSDGAEVTDCRFEGNGFLDNFGGGLWAQSSMHIEACDFIDNRAGDGGGAHVGSGVEFLRCVFRGNVAANTECKGAGGRGGGLLVRPGSVGVLVDRSLFHDNQALDCEPEQGRGRGGAVDGPAFLERCTLAENFASVEGGGGMGVDVHDSVVWDNAPDGLAGASSADWSLVQDMFPGTNTVDVDPVFIRPQDDDFHLALASPCIDAGDPASPLDADGSPGDMGAFPACDCNGNGAIDGDDIGDAISEDVNGNGFPDECECFSESYCEGAENSTGIGALMGLAGTVSFSQNDLVLEATRCPANKAGLFFFGAGQVQVVFGDGFRCVGAPVFRRLLRVTDMNGRATDAVNNTVGSANGRILSGSTWNFQFWYRDPGGPGGTGFNLTDAVSATFCP